MAARSGRAASGHADDRVSQQPFARRFRGRRGSLPARSRCIGIYRGAKCRDHLSLGGGPLRPVAGFGGRTRGLARGRPVRGRRHALGAAAKAATRTIPVVFSAVDDPVAVGLVPSLNRPGGNITGMSFLNFEIIAKSAQLLKEMVPAAAAIAYLVNPSNPTAEIYAKQAPIVASALGIRVPVLNASTEHELDECFASLGKIGAVALIVPAEPFFDSQRDRIVVLAVRYAVPMIAGLREYVTAGGLMSYGPSLPDSYHRAGIYVGRVLKGENPADLPVMQPTKFDLVLNLKTAKALGLTVPDRLLALADEVIE